MKRPRLTYERPQSEVVLFSAPVVMQTSSGDYSNMENEEYVVDGKGTWQNFD
jgi:hypothetical protein